MFSINRNSISLTRGDSLYITITLTKDLQEFTPNETDVVHFAVKKNYDDPEYLIVKELKPNSAGEFILELLPEDTKSLPFGTYRYDLSYDDGNGLVYTFVIDAINLTKEVY